MTPEQAQQVIELCKAIELSEYEIDSFVGVPDKLTDGNYVNFDFGNNQSITVRLNAEMTYTICNQILRYKEAEAEKLKTQLAEL
jgi:hypothetical protein